MVIKLMAILFYKNVIVLNDESVQAITENDQQISFNYTTNQTDSIKEGTVIVATKIENDKIRNILAKVVSVSGAGSQTVLEQPVQSLKKLFTAEISAEYMILRNRLRCR